RLRRCLVWLGSRLGAFRLFGRGLLHPFGRVASRKRERIVRFLRTLGRLSATVQIGQVHVRLRLFRWNLHLRLGEHEAALVTLAFELLAQELLPTRFELLLTREQKVELWCVVKHEKDQDVDDERNDDYVADRNTSADDLLVLIPFLEVEVNQRTGRRI